MLKGNLRGWQPISERVLGDERYRCLLDKSNLNLLLGYNLGSVPVCVMPVMLYRAELNVGC